MKVTNWISKRSKWRKKEVLTKKTARAVIK
jgi:hypothetical protein